MTEKNPYFASTFAERKAIREAREGNAEKAPETDVKQVDNDEAAVENKAVKPAETKRPARKKS